ncbi:hypothetical protein QQS21_001436 [Conoideocrella luteorostrata]|uniref:Glucose-methanol-choline oxidoreductase N-terminal domain-containing protein n=1 Tax=Conoideocrella luteorostrata TaxID=1105319 RepID=A0AAJ0CXT6_9HYPO|nr:hypothetical protein QQS21_001436 [Conoideocrella luteorostrata]
MPSASALLWGAFLATSPALVAGAPSADWAAQSWDAIVVGAGTAGIIVADRLSEAGHKTLLLEQGGKSYGIVGGHEAPAWLSGTNLSRVDVPGLYSTIFAGKSDLLCPPDQVSAFQACTVGGNSAINAGLYFQPPASDWDDYHPPGWRSADVQPSIDRLLRRQPALTSYSPDGQFHVQSGYDEVRKWIVDGAGYSNVSFLDDVNNKEMVFGRPVYNYINGQRGGPARTYLQSALARKNFRLETGVHVKHVEHMNGVASGVAVDAGNGQIKSVKLTRTGRVVLSAGAMLSPKILMYSGIGPRHVLAKLAAKSVTPYNESSWIVQPQVGEGLFDNPNTFIVLSSPNVESYVYKYDDPIPRDRDMYLNTRSGPYSFASQTSAFWTYVNHADGTRAGVQGTISSSGYSDFTGNNTITLNIYGTSGLLSSGRVELSDDGKFIARPSSDVYYSQARDGEDVAGFIHSLFRHLPASSPASPAQNGLTPLNLPQNSTLEEIQKYITTPSAYAAGSVNHWSSSCRLGQCVDADTKVMGTNNIHVVDASILAPLTVNPQFAVMVAAEKGSERILAAMQGKGCRRKRRRAEQN